MNMNLQSLSTEKLIKELEQRGYKTTKIKEKKVAPTITKEVELNIDCKKIFEEKTQQELESYLNGYSKLQINEFYNQITDNNIKLTGNKADYIDTIILRKKAINRGRAFQEWVK